MGGRGETNQEGRRNMWSEILRGLENLITSLKYYQPSSRHSKYFHKEEKVKQESQKYCRDVSITIASHTGYDGILSTDIAAKELKKRKKKEQREIQDLGYQFYDRKPLESLEGL